MDPNTENPEDKKPEEKVESVVIETPEESKDEYSYKEVHETPVKEIAKNEELPEGEGEEEEEEEKEEVKPEEKPEEVKEEIPVEKIIEDTVKKTVENLKPADAKVEKSAYDEFFEKIKAEKGRDPNWQELSQFMEDRAVERVNEERIAKEKAESEKVDAEKKTTEELTKKFNLILDEEIEEIYKKGELTPIKDKNSPNDQGVIERKALFQAMLDTNAKRAAENLPPIMSISRIFYGGYYVKPNAKQAGEDAPISMGNGSPAGNEDEEEIDYKKDVHKPWPSFHIPNLGKK